MKRAKTYCVPEIQSRARTAVVLRPRIGGYVQLFFLEQDMNGYRHFRTHKFGKVEKTSIVEKTTSAYRTAFATNGKQSLALGDVLSLIHI